MPQKLNQSANADMCMGRNQLVLICRREFDSCFTLPSAANPLEHKDWAVFLFGLSNQVLLHVIHQGLPACKQRIGSAWHVPMCIA